MGKYVEKPGLHITTGNAYPGQYFDGDALTSEPLHEYTETGARPLKKRRGVDAAHVVPYVPEPPPHHPTLAGDRGGKRARNGGTDKSIHDGVKFLKNRAGCNLCRGLSDGSLLKAELMVLVRC